MKIRNLCLPFMPRLGDRTGDWRPPAPCARQAIAAACAALALIPLAALSTAPAQAEARSGRAAPAGRGAVISATLIARLAEPSVAAELSNARLAPGAPSLGAAMVRYGVVAYRVLYRTVTAEGQPVRASGLVAFPAGGPRQLRVVSYAHGTTTYKPGAPSSFGLDASQDGLEGRWSAELFASAGFAVSEPDYVGMGLGPGRPEYMVARSEASAAADLLSATQSLAARQGHRVSRNVLVTGFSQGGAAAMALGRALAQRRAAPGSPFRLAALAPVSGPYDLAGAELPGIFNGQVAASVAPYYVGYTLTAWNSLYHLYAAPAQAFRQPYAAQVEALFDGSHPDEQVIAALPSSLSGLLTARYLHLLRHPSGTFLRALDSNSTCSGWTPRVPVRLYAASGDTTVTQVNAQHCVRSIRANGGDAQLIQLGPVSHSVSDFLALPSIAGWFARWLSR